MGVSRKQNTPHFPKNQPFLPDMHTQVCVSGGKKSSISENLEYFVFLTQSFCDSPFCLITDKLTQERNLKENPKILATSSTNLEYIRSSFRKISAVIFEQYTNLHILVYNLLCDLRDPYYISNDSLTKNIGESQKTRPNTYFEA